MKSALLRLNSWVVGIVFALSACTEPPTRSLAPNVQPYRSTDVAQQGARPAYSCDNTFYPGGSSSWPKAPKLTDFNLPNTQYGGQDVVAYIALDSNVPFACTLSLAVTSHGPAVNPPALQAVVQLAGFYNWHTASVKAATSVAVDVEDSYGTIKIAFTTILPSGSQPPPKPGPPQLAGLTVNPPILAGGNQSTATAILTSPAGAGGIVIALSSSNAAVASSASSILIPAGQSTASVAVTTAPVSAPTAVTITASYGSVAKSATLKVIAASALPTYDVTDLGTLGGRASQAYALTDQLGSGIGAVVGVSTTSTNVEHAFMWRPNSGMVDLTPGDSRYSAAMGAQLVRSRRGSVCCFTRLVVVGNQSIPSPQGSAWGVTFAVTAGDNPLQVGDQDDHDSGWLGTLADHTIAAVSPSGLVVGNYGKGSNTNCNISNVPRFNNCFHMLSQAFSYSLVAGNLTELPPINTDNAYGSQGYASGVNASNEIVGAAGSATSSSARFTHATYWYSGTTQDLGSLGGSGTQSRANAISDNDLIVGSSVSSTGQWHATTWKLGGSMADLGTLGGGSSEAFAITAGGDKIVGISSTTAQRSHAFIYSDSFGMIDLNNAIPGGSGWELTEARGVNASGEIAGTGTHSGQTRAFLLTPRAQSSCGSDVSGSVSVTRSGFRITPGNGHFQQTLTIVNTSSSAIAGPLVVALDGLSNYATLANATGSTQCVAPAASPYLSIPLGTSSSLAAGATASVVLDVIDPSRQAIAYATRVLAGARF